MPFFIIHTFSGRRTLHNPFCGRDKPWDPYGVAKVDMSELLLGHRYLEMTVPIHNCPLPDALGLNAQASGKIVGVAGAVDGPGEFSSQMPLFFLFFYFLSKKMLNI